MARLQRCNLHERFRRGSGPLFFIFGRGGTVLGFIVYGCLTLSLSVFYIYLPYWNSYWYRACRSRGIVFFGSACWKLYNITVLEKFMKLNRNVMKRMNVALFRSLLGLALSLGIVTALEAQSVSTEVQKKAVLLEEYTGVGCGNCPDGAAMAAMIKQAGGDRFYIISIHEGHYAETEPDYRTEWGAALLEQAGDIGFPQGSLDRVQYEGSTMNANRGSWTKRAKALMQEEAEVNLHMEASVDAQSREMNIKVEYCYPETFADEFHLLNIALLQNHVIGRQNGAGDSYSHEHMLRDLITGQWGDTLSALQPGQVYVKEYTYAVPEKVGEIEVDIRNIELVAFVTRTTADVLNTTGAKPRIDNLDEPMALSASAVDLGAARYAGKNFPARIRNLCNDTLKRVEYAAEINGQVQNGQLDVVIPPYQELMVEFTVDDYEPLASNEVSVTVVSANGESLSLPELQYKFTGPMPISSDILYVEWETDDCPDEVAFTVKDRNGRAVYAQGPFEAGSGKQVLKDTVVLESDGIYSLEFSDSWLDGWLEGDKGSFKVKTADGKLLGQNYSVRGAGETIFVDLVKSTNSETDRMESELKILPVEGGLRILNPDLSIIRRVQVFDMRGALLFDKVMDVRDDVFVPFTVKTVQIGVVKVFTDKGISVTKAMLY